VSKRARGRSGGRRPFSNSANRSFDSSGPDVKIRGTAAHIYEKYQALARDASSSGDRIAAENYMQHAEHYYRILVASNAAQNQAQQGHQPPHGQGEQPHPHGQQGEHEGNGRGYGGNGQRQFDRVDADDDEADLPPRPPRRIETTDEARTIEPASSGPTSFGPLPEPEPAAQPATQSLRELAESSGRNTGAPAEGAEAASEDSDDGEGRKAGRRKPSSKDRPDTAPAG
jgi:hypothetical protein